MTSNNLEEIAKYVGDAVRSTEFAHRIEVVTYENVAGKIHRVTRTIRVNGDDYQWDARTEIL